MKIGCIFCAYNAADMLRGSLQPWIDARKSHLGGHDYLIAAVSVPFKSFNEPRTDDTLSVLQFSLAGNAIDHLVLSEQPMLETEARGAALQWLVEAGAEIVIQADADEFPTTAEIERTVSFISDRPFVAAARGCLKNYVFTDKTWLKEPFTPFRVHRCHYRGWRAARFWDDNNVMYSHPSGQEIRDIDLPCVQIPRSVQFIRHHSWLSNERSRRKVEYQTLGRGWQCSFAWDESKGLVWSPGHEQETAQD